VFHQRIQQPGESIEDFVADLRKLTKSFAFEQLEDTDTGQAGSRHSRRPDSPSRTTGEKSIALDAIDACEATEATNRRLQTMNGNAPAEIDALTTATTTSRRRGRRSSKSRDRASQRDMVNSARRCLYCDRQHGGSKESCPAFGQQCRKCGGKKNHFQKVCRSTTTVKPEVCEITREELLTLQNGDTDRAYCNLRVNHRTVCFLLDCALCSYCEFTDVEGRYRDQSETENAASTRVASNDVRRYGVENYWDVDRRRRTSADSRTSTDGLLRRRATRTRSFSLCERAKKWNCLASTRTNQPRSGLQLGVQYRRMPVVAEKKQEKDSATEDVL